MSNEYDKLLSLVDWYFQCEDAQRYLRVQLANGKVTLDTYKELSVWAGAVEFDLRVLCSIRTCDAVQLPLFSKKRLPSLFSKVRLPFFGGRYDK